MLQISETLRENGCGSIIDVGVGTGRFHSLQEKLVALQYCLIREAIKFGKSVRFGKVFRSTMFE